MIHPILPQSIRSTFMDNKTTITEVASVVITFCKERNWEQFHNAKDLAIGISTEANELLQIFRFKSDEEILEIINSQKKSEIEEELADIFYFILLFAKTNEIDLSDALFAKINKNAEKYPIEKAKGSNKKYSELQ